MSEEEDEKLDKKALGGNMGESTTNQVSQKKLQ